MESNNYAELCGTLGACPVYSHTLRDEVFYTFPLEVERLSGTADRINIILRRELMESLELEERSHIAVRGELRSYNNKSGVGSRLVITVLARQIYFTDEEDRNIVLLRGALCREPNLRRTPMGREICDLMLAVNRRYGRSDYLPCIAWGRCAQLASRLGVGSPLCLTGRIQSRNYIKNENGEAIEKTAFEVSAVEIDAGAPV